jgi:hypothetical protein
MTKVIYFSRAGHLSIIQLQIALLIMKLYEMKLEIRNNRMISDLQKEFASAYPFLKLEFYKKNGGRTRAESKQKLSRTLAMTSIGLLKEGEIEINDTMTVAQLENILSNKFGICAQVSRKSGTLWLETTISDNWTLKQQNDHGRELSEHLRRE